MPPERLLAVAAGTSPGEVFVGGLHGVYQTFDCGRTWRRLLVPLDAGFPARTSDAVGVLSVGPGGTIYVGDDSALLVSRDRGATWQALGSINARSLAPSRALPGLVYAIFDFVSLGGLPGVARSVDDGRTWERVRTFVTSGAVAADPDDASTLYLGLAACAQSTPTGCARLSGRLEVSHDAGATSSPVAEFPSRITGLQISADGARMWLATEEGALYVSRDRGRTWAAVACVACTAAAAEPTFAGYPLSVAVSLVEPGLLFALTDRGEVWVYREAGGIGFPRVGGGPDDRTGATAPMGDGDSRAE